MMFVERKGTRIKVIHKTGHVIHVKVVEEVVSYKPEEIRVLDYESKFTGEEAIKRARALSGESYGLFTANCEHFVTEARTGIKLSATYLQQQYRSHDIAVASTCRCGRLYNQKQKQELVLQPVIQPVIHQPFLGQNLPLDR